jgi:replicative DNA helicase
VIRGFCDAGAAVLVAAAVARQRGQTGANYKGLNLASFRGSSELEYGTDSAYMLMPHGSDGITLHCEKNRYGAVADIMTRFDPITQTFTPAPSGLDGFDAATPAPTKRGKAKGG